MQSTHTNTLPIKDILEWNVPAWSPVIDLWNEGIAQNNLSGSALEIGARHGGISLFLAKMGFNVVCSDVKEPSERALHLHKKYSVEKQMKYEKIDATNLPFADSSIDLVAFKSVLGGIAYIKGQTSPEKAITEIHRVLKPGGIIIFAENLSGFWLHKFLRKAFIHNRGPNATWVYLAYKDFSDLFSGFSKTTIRTSGCLAPLAQTPVPQKILSCFDQFLDPFIPNNRKVICYGYAIK